jgi:hypothetical protein
MCTAAPTKLHSNAATRRFRSRISRSLFIRRPVAQLRRPCSNEPQRFCAAYRKLGGGIDLHYIAAERHTGRSPDLSQTGDMFARMMEFVGRHVR